MPGIVEVLKKNRGPLIIGGGVALVVILLFRNKARAGVGGQTSSAPVPISSGLAEDVNTEEGISAADLESILQATEDRAVGRMKRWTSEDFFPGVQQSLEAQTIGVVRQEAPNIFTAQMEQYSPGLEKSITENVTEKFLSDGKYQKTEPEAPLEFASFVRDLVLIKKDYDTVGGMTKKQSSDAASALRAKAKDAGIDVLSLETEATNQAKGTNFTPDQIREKAPYLAAEKVV